jgi:porin
MTTPVQPRHLRRVSFSALLFTALCPYSLSPQQTVISHPAGWLDRATLTGDWAGLRTTPEDSGVQLRADFTTESAANPLGGEGQSARYTQEVAFGAELDLSRLLGSRRNVRDYVHRSR